METRSSKAFLFVHVLKFINNQAKPLLEVQEGVFLNKDLNRLFKSDPKLL